MQKRIKITRFVDLGVIIKNKRIDDINLYYKYCSIYVINDIINNFAVLNVICHVNPSFNLPKGNMFADFANKCFVVVFITCIFIYMPAVAFDSFVINNIQFCNTVYK